MLPRRRIRWSGSRRWVVGTIEGLVCQDMEHGLASTICGAHRRCKGVLIFMIPGNGGQNKCTRIVAVSLASFLLQATFGPSVSNVTQQRACYRHHSLSTSYLSSLTSIHRQAAQC